MARARLDLIHAIHCPQVERVRGKAVERIGRHPQDLPGANLVGGVADQRSFRSITVDLEDFYAHRLLPGSLYLRKVKITRGWPLLMRQAVRGRVGSRLAYDFRRKERV